MVFCLFHVMFWLLFSFQGQPNSGNWSFQKKKKKKKGTIHTFCLLSFHLADNKRGYDWFSLLPQTRCFWNKKETSPQFFCFVFCKIYEQLLLQNDKSMTWSVVDRLDLKFSRDPIILLWLLLLFKCCNSAESSAAHIHLLWHFKT